MGVVGDEEIVRGGGTAPVAADGTTAEDGSGGAGGRVSPISRSHPGGQGGESSLLLRRPPPWSLSIRPRRAKQEEPCRSFAPAKITQMHLGWACPVSLLALKRAGLSSGLFKISTCYNMKKNIQNSEMEN